MQTNVNDNIDRLVLGLEYSKLLLTNKYKINVPINDDMKDKTIREKIEFEGQIDADNNNILPILNENTDDSGFDGCYHCLSQKFIYYFLDKYDKIDILSIEQKHNGIFINDTPTDKDKILGFPISGTELRIYNADMYMYLEGVYYMRTFYLISDFSLITSEITIRSFSEWNSFLKKIVNDINIFLRNIITEKNILENVKKYFDEHYKKIYTPEMFSKECDILNYYCTIYRPIIYLKKKYLKYKEKYLTLRENCIKILPK